MRVLALGALILASSIDPLAARGRDTPTALGATQTYNDALRTSAYGNYLAGRLASNARDFGAAAVFWRAALARDPRNAEILERAFVTAALSGQVDIAMGLAERLVQVDRAHRLARLALAVRAIKSRQFERARSHLTVAPTANPDVTSTLLIGWAYFGAGDTATAIQTVDRLGGQDWYVLIRDFHAGLILDAAGRRRSAGQRLEAAYRREQNALRVVEAFARWTSRARGPTEALAVIAAFDKASPNNPAIASSRAALSRQERLQPLVRNATAGAAEVLYGLGTILSRDPSGEELSIVYLQFARWLEPGNDLAIIALADLFDQLKQPAQAIAVFEQMPAGSPLARNALIQKAVNLDQIDRTDEARAALNGLIQRSPNDLEALQALANILRARKLFEEAAEVYSRAIALVPNPDRQHWHLFYFRGIAYERTKRWPLAEADLKRALELVPANNTRGKAQVLNYLGYSWVDQGVNLDEGLRLVKEAVALTPEDGYIVDSLGWAYFRLGRFEEAVAELERAIELRPEDPVINDHLGDAYWKVGRIEEAFFQWAHARDLKPEPEDLPRILDKLQNGLREPAAAASAGGAAPAERTAPN